ncbi:MAG: hypothetical protein NVV59_16430 [Chitinophagaceae bacterium]|nr:hypothetical protein [Chitinophagaceae bacterium]
MRILLLIPIIALGCNTNQSVDTVSTNTQDTLAVFEPSLISDGFDNRDMTISPDGKELFYTIQYENKRSYIMHAVYSNGQLQEPTIAWFSGVHKDLEAAFSPDGNEIYFASDRPLIPGENAADYNIWKITRSINGWSEPVALDSSINTRKDEYYPSIASNGNLYFTRDNGATLEDIWIAVKNGDFYHPAIPMEDAVNSKGYDFNAFVSPDEEFIVFTSYKRPDDLGSGDLYFSRKKDGQWQPAVHLDAPFNSTAIDYCPFVSPDKKYFYFTSARITRTLTPDSANTKSALNKLHGGPGSGSDDIYRVPMSELERYF